MMKNTIPERWTIRKIEDIATRVEKNNTGEDIPVLTISSLSGFLLQEDRFSKVQAGNSLSKYVKLKRGEFSYNKGNSKTYPYGCIFKLEDHEEALVPNVYISFKIHGQNLDYMQYYFHARMLDKQLRRLISSSARMDGLLNINVDEFFKCKVLLPPIEEQNKIASVLQEIDKHISLLNNQVEELTELKRALAKKLLSEGIGHEDFKDSEVGRIPLSWSIKDISQISSSCNNGFVGTAAPFYTDEETGIPYMMGNNVRANRLDLRDRVFITKEFTDSNPRARINTGDTLTVQSGHIGTTCVVPEEFNNAFCHALIITKYKESVNSDYVAYYLNSDIGMKRLQNIFVGTTIKHINTKDFVKFKIPIPDINEQIKISNILKDFDKQISQYQQQKSDYTQLKAGLMQQLLTGKIRVKCDK